MDAQVEDLLRSTLDSYRTALKAMGKCGVQAYPEIGQDLQQSMASLQAHLQADTTPGAILDTGKNVEDQLEQWSLRAAEYFKHKAAEAKEIMVVLARTAQAVSERDQRYGGQFHDITRRLETIAGLEDLSKIRSSLLESVGELRTSVQKMEEDGQESVAELRAELSAYQSRLEEAELLASRDQLTGLDNRRELERRLEQFIQRGRKFSVMLFDLNGFKEINDAHGHLAGDQLLRQFGAELRSFFQPTHNVGRWGGDEFIAVLDCELAAAQTSLERARKWLFGSYQIETPSGVRKIAVGGEIGLAEWAPGEKLGSLLGRADAAMYGQKSRRRI
jgi:diguanylate cyclase (GGDEF)-like protein